MMRSVIYVCICICSVYMCKTSAGMPIPCIVCVIQYLDDFIVCVIQYLDGWIMSMYSY